MNRLPCHIQISKTGTNTARSLLAESYPPDRLLAFKILDREIGGAAVTVGMDEERIGRFRREIEERQWTIDAATMMLPVGVHAFLERPVEYFSFVRDPVARCLSAINFVFNRKARHPVADQYASLGWSAEKIVDSGDIDYHNDQVRMLSGSARMRVDESDLETAKRNVLDMFFMVGTTEHFAACWERIASHFALCVDSSRRENASDYTAGLPVTQRDIEAIGRANALDIALYEWICREYLPDSHGLTLPRAPALAGQVR